MNSYQQLCAEFYDIDKPAAPADALEYYAAIVSQAGGPALEPMCGSGRLLVPLLERGHDVDGVDGSGHMLDRCRTRCAALGFNPALSQQLLHELSLSRRYRLIFIPEGSFSLVIDPNEARESLRRMHAALVPGGRLVIDVERYEGSENHRWPWDGRSVTRPDGARIIYSRLGHFDATRRISYSMGRYDLVEGGKLLETEFEEFNLRQYERNEFSALLEECGFIRVQMLPHYRQNSSSPEGSLLFEAIRAESR